MNTTRTQGTRKTSAARHATDWSAQNAEGRRYAHDLLRTMSQRQAPIMFQHALARMSEDGTPQGVIVGFLQVFGEAAMRGAYLQ